MENVQIEIMSGVDDGDILILNSDNDGLQTETEWVISVGRKDSNDICLRNDTFVSRHHANLLWRDGEWWVEDKRSTNGSFLENVKDTSFMDIRIMDIVPLEPGQLFRIGRTWFQILPEGESL